MARAFSLLLLLAAVGCTPMAYMRPGVTAAQAEADARDCRGMAAAEAPPLFAYPSWYYRRYGDPLLDRMQNENNLSDFCMRARGYRLTPVRPPS